MSRSEPRSDGVQQTQVLADNENELTFSSSYEPKSVGDFLTVGKELLRSRRSEEAVRSCKKGLELYPSNSGLENLLREARMAVVEDLCDSGSGDDSDGESRVIETATNDTIYTTFANNRIQLSSLETAGNEIMTFDEKLDKIVQHLEINKLMRLGTWYIMLQLIKIRRVVIGILLLVGGLFVHAILYRHKLMALSILIICLYQSKVRNITDEYMQKWIHQSTDKLGAVTWIPRAIAILPIVLKLFGHLKFMLFLQQDLVLSLIVSTVTSAVVILTWNLDETHPMKVWGRDKRLKFVAYLSTIMYWAIWCGNYIDTLRLLAPALIDGGGITLDSVSSEDIQKACRRAWKRLFNEVSADIKQRIPMDALFFMGLTNWIIDYWQQPTNLSFEMLSKMLSDCFSRLEKGAAHVFRPELRRLSQQMRDVGRDKDFELFVVYLKQSIATIPPSKRMGYFGLLAKRCPSFVVGILLIVFYGVLSISLLPFIVSESIEARALLSLYRSDEMESMDGLDIMLLNSPLLRVWENSKACVYCLEGGAVFSKAVATGTQIAATAARIGQLVSFATKIKVGGLATHAAEVPEHINHAFMIANNYSSIADGLREVLDSRYFHDACNSLLKWWNKKTD